MKTSIEVPTWDKELECRMFFATEANCAVHFARSRSWVNTSWNFGTAKVHLNEPEEPEYDSDEKAYEGYITADVYQLRTDGYRLVKSIRTYYDPVILAITVGDVLAEEGFYPIQTVLELE